MDDKDTEARMRLKGIATILVEKLKQVLPDDETVVVAVVLYHLPTANIMTTGNLQGPGLKQVLALALPTLNTPGEPVAEMH